MEVSASAHKFQDIYTSFLNGVPFEKLDLLKRDFHLSGDALVMNMITEKPIHVKGFVNEHILPVEEQNTLRVSVIDLKI